MTPVSPHGMASWVTLGDVQGNGFRSILRASSRLLGHHVQRRALVGRNPTYVGCLFPGFWIFFCVFLFMLRTSGSSYSVEVYRAGLPAGSWTTVSVPVVGDAEQPRGVVVIRRAFSRGGRWRVRVSIPLHSAPLAVHVGYGLDWKGLGRWGVAKWKGHTHEMSRLSSRSCRRCGLCVGDWTPAHRDGMYDAGVLVQHGGGVAVVVKASVGYMPAGKTAVRL